MNEPALNTEVRLPRQVKALADRARALELPVIEDQPTPGVEVVDAPPTAKEVVEAKATPDPTPQPQPFNQEREQYWLDRVKTVEGMFRAKYKRRIDGLQTELKAARDAIRELESKRQDSAEIDLSEFFTAEQIEVLGEDQAMIQASVIKKQATKIARDLVEREVLPLQKQRKDDEDEEAQDEQLKFLSRLSALCPHWKEVNVDPRWLVYLEQVEPNSGFYRQEIITKAQDNGDAERVARMIREFEATLSPVPVPAEPSRVPAGHGAPAGSPPPPPETNQGPPSKYEIRDHFKRKSIGKISQQEISEFQARMKAAGMA